MTCNSRPKRRGSGKGVWVNPADLKSEQAGKTFDRPYRRRPNRPSMVVICEIAQKRERNEQMLLKNTFTAPTLLRITMKQPIDTLRSAGDLAADNPHGVRIRYMAGCRCVPCRAANSSYETERAAARRRGEWNGLVPVEKAVEHIRHLSSKGVGYKQVADAAGLSRRSGR